MRLFVVTGMHRSGTSAVAALAEAVGADLGDPDSLLPPAPDNPRGFFELREFKAVNDQLLQAFGGTWERPPALPAGWENNPDLGGLVDRATAILDELEVRGTDVVVLKDPRASLTLPFWRLVRRIDGTVLPLRDPHGVAASLARRNDMPAETTARLWWTYVAASMANDPDTLLLPYADVVARPDDAAARLARHFGLPAASPGDVAEVIDAALDHGRIADPEDDGPAMSAAARMFHRLVTGGADARDTILDALQLAARPELDETSDLRDQLVQARTHITERDAKIDGLNARIDSLRDEVTRLTERRDAERERAVAIERRLAEVREQAKQERRRAASTLARNQEKLDDRDHQIAQLNQSLAEVVALRKDVSRQLRRTREELNHLRNRRSVRVALKVASLAKPVRRDRGPEPDQSAVPDESVALVEEVPVEASAAGDRAVDERLAFDPTRAPMDEVVTVVIPVHDSPEEVRRCLDAVLRNTTSPAHLVVVDDASTLDETRDLLASYGEFPNVTLLRNDENLGFTRSVNRGLEACDTDVVILNSDTEVPPRWLHGLRIAAHSAEDVGTATAVSDDAGAFAVPVIGQRNEVPAWLGVDAAGRAMARAARWVLPETPTGNGFCMYIRRAMLDEVGMLDAEAFPVGYGEENDLCMRAGRAGWRHVVADRVFVRHAKGSSFGEERREQLIAAGRKVLDKRYTEYTERIRAFVTSDAMDRVRDNARAALWDRSRATTPTGGPRVLYVLHEGRGGTPATSLDLGVELADRYDSMLLTSDTRTIRLRVITQNGAELVEEHRLERPIEFADHRRDDVRALLADILVRHAVELVHIRHVVKSTLDIFDVARDLDIPYVVSFHDFYLSCPTVHLLDDQDRFCGGVCTPGDGACRIPMGWIADTAPHLKHRGVNDWRNLVRPYLEHAAALITTSQTARDVYLRSYPTLDPARLHVIEHGRDLDHDPVGWLPPDPDEAIRLLVPGNLDVHKGSLLVRRMLEADANGRIEIHQLGELDDDSELLGVVHGAYERHEFVDRVREIRPHLIAILATWAETYNHTLSEAWMTGVPVVATDIGALGERIRAHGGGFLVPPDDPDEALRRILAMADDPDALRAVTALEDDAVRSVASMGDDYDAVYRAAIAERRTLDGRPPVRIGLVALGQRSEAPGSVQVRSLRPLSHPAVYGDLATCLVTVDDLVDGRVDVDLAVVQRTAVPEDRVDDLLRALDERGVPLVVEVDDLLFDPELLPDGDEDWELHVHAMRALLKAADLVTVSTATVAEAVRNLNDAVEIVANHLDERLWFADFEAPDVSEDPDAPVRLFYMGSKTHHADLESIRPVLEGLRERLDRPVELDVVGGTSEHADWFHRIPVPRGKANYPEFAHWLATVAPGHVAALAPLFDTPFTRAKSDLKWLEYTALGLPGVFSDVPAYGSVRDCVTGLVVADDPAEWIEATARLIEDRPLAATLVDNARHEILADRILDRRVRHRILLYRGIVSADRQGTNQTSK